MGRILFAGGGGGGEHSSDLTAKKAWVLTGKTYVGNDTDDEAGTGTMANIGATDTAKSVAQSGSYLVMRMSNGAHITNASSGYPEVRASLADVRKAINYTNAAKVLNDTTIAGLTGTMKNLSSSPSTRHTSSNTTPVLIGDAAYWTTNADGKARIQIRYNGAAGYISANTLFGVEKATMKSAVISAYGISSITTFKISQYNTKTVLCSWTKPGNGKMWSGVVVRAKQGGYPTSVSDGTEITGGTTGTSVTKALAVGTWYFKFWNYVTVSKADGTRWYDSGTNGGTFANKEVKGSKNFTGSTTYTVPEGVRKITAFVVGGGGGVTNPWIAKTGVGMSSGAAGGYTKTLSFYVTPGEKLTITVGGGGNGDQGGSGGTSGIYRGSSALITAGGGGNANYATASGYNQPAGRPSGANGGSGGGSSYGVGSGASKDADGYGGNGGSDGSAGGQSRYSSWNSSGSQVMHDGVAGGRGQGSSTKAWGNTGQPYAPGGGGIGMGRNWGRYGSEGTRAAGGAGLTGANSGAASFNAWRKCGYERDSVWDANIKRSYGASGIVMIKWG